MMCFTWDYIPAVSIKQILALRLGVLDIGPWQKKRHWLMMSPSSRKMEKQANHEVSRWHNSSLKVLTSHC